MGSPTPRRSLLGLHQGFVMKWTACSHAAILRPVRARGDPRADVLQRAASQRQEVWVHGHVPDTVRRFDFSASWRAVPITSSLFMSGRSTPTLVSDRKGRRFGRTLNSSTRMQRALIVGAETPIRRSCLAEE